MAGWALALGDSEGAMFISMGTAAFGYVVEILVGLPLLTLAARRGRVSLLTVLAIGAVSTMATLAAFSIAALALFGSLGHVGLLEGYLNLVIIGVPLALAAAFTLWFLGYRRSKG
jgi:hypothetical protein